MFNNKPKQRIAASIILPPYERKGSGIPTTGKSPVTMPIFMKKCDEKNVEIPTATKR